MNVSLNGSPTTLRAGATVADAVATVTTAPSGRGIAVAVNGTVVPRGDWGSARLHAGDKVEILTAVAGG